MNRYYNSRGTAIAIGKQLGSGGEGAVFETTDPARVAKVYHNPVTSEKEAKLAAMVTMATDALTSSAAWPLETIHASPGGRVCGIVMPRIQGHSEIHNLYSPAHRKVKYPDKTWTFLVHVAMNCAAAFDSIHRAGHVIGDVNQGNVLVSAEGTVRLIDCDSFQVVAGGRSYLCEVGVPQFTPPELHGKKFKGVLRSPDHDRFGLAVLVFHLLFMGRHPFAGRFVGAGDMPLERAIKEGRYVFGANAKQYQMCCPPHSVDVSGLSTPVAQLLEKAFAVGVSGRPTAQDWHSRLSDLKRSLGPCSVDSSHVFPRTAPNCPWCRIVAGGGPSFFLVQSRVGQSFAPSVDARRLWDRIIAVAPPSLVAVPVRGRLAISPRPLGADLSGSRSFARLLKGAMCVFAAMNVFGLISTVVLLFSVPLTIVFGVWWAIMMYMSSLGIERGRRQASVSRAATVASRLQTQRDHLINEATARHDRRLEELREIRDRLNGLKRFRDEQVQAVEREAARVQKEAYLQSVFLSDYRLPRIGAGRIAVLQSYGIETAHDIDGDRIRDIPGFGDSLTEQLVAWRSTIEAQFSFNAATGVPSQRRALIETECIQRRLNFERALRNGADDLHRLARDAEASAKAMDAPLSNALAELAQAQADMRVF